MRNIIVSISILLIIAVLFSSCGLIFGGSKYTGVVTAVNHPNAVIYVNGQREGTGQISGRYFRNRPLEIELKEEGCEAITQTYYNTFRTGNFVLSVFSWGLFSFLDVGTGASFKPDHKNYREVIKNSMNRYTFNIEGDCYPVSTAKVDTILFLDESNRR